MPVPSPLVAPPIPDTDLLSFLLDRPATGYPPTRTLFQSDTDAAATLDFTTLRGSVKRLGGGLRERAGVRPGDRVLVLALHGLHYPVALLGIMCAGATCVPVNPALLVSDIDKYLAATGGEVMLVGGMFLDVARALQDRYPNLAVYEIDSIGPLSQGRSADSGASDLSTTSTESKASQGKRIQKWSSLFDVGEIDWPRSREAQESTAVIAFSSGTSGLPKGCEITQHNIVANQWIVYHGTLARSASDPDGTSGASSRHDIVLGAFPPFHVAGIWGSMINPIYRGNTQIIMSGFTFPSFLALIQQHKPTELAVAPPIVLGLAVGPGVEKVDFSSVRRVGVGAAPLSAELSEKCLVRLRACGAKNIRMRQVWGMTETVCCASAFIDDVSAAYDEKEETLISGSVGFPLPHLILRLVDPETNREISKAGERGEILIRGPCVFKGYLPSTLPSSTKTSDFFTEDGFYRTGDVGIADAEGRLRIVDRIKELIKVSGFQVAPAELEGILLSHSNVSDCAVIGIQPRPGASEELSKKGEMVLAFIVPRASTGPKAIHPERLRKQIHAWFNPQVVPYKRLSGGIRIVREIPKSPSGKILRRLLRDQIAEEWKSQAKDLLTDRALANL